MMFATALALLSQEFHGRERGTAFGLWGAAIGAAVAIGPLAGGMLTSWLSWRWIFLVNIPIGVGCDRSSGRGSCASRAIRSTAASTRSGSSPSRAACSA